MELCRYCHERRATPGETFCIECNTRRVVVKEDARGVTAGRQWVPSQVAWELTSCGLATDDDPTVPLIAPSNIYLVGRMTDAPPQVLQFIAALLGAKVNYDPVTGAIMVDADAIDPTP